jgi:hypothetical protein
MRSPGISLIAATTADHFVDANKMMQLPRNHRQLTGNPGQFNFRGSLGSSPPFPPTAILAAKIISKKLAWSY